MELGIIGLGKMGGNLALQCVSKDIRVVGKTKTSRPDLVSAGVNIEVGYGDFVGFLKTPRVIYLSLPAGETVDKVIEELVPHLDHGDVIMDGGNSYYRDSIRREREVTSRGIHYVDCGTSGGLEGARSGACFMIGGTDEAAMLCEPVLKALAVEGGFVHTGKPGSGHFVKLVHNGIEFGMLQAIGEGVELMKHSDFHLNLHDIFRNWSNGSVIRSWLVELMAGGLEEVHDLNAVPAYIEDTGEVNWLVQEAIDREIPIPVITQSVIELFRSRRRESDAYRAIAMIRHGFGGHPFGKDESIAKERKTSKAA